MKQTKFLLIFLLLLMVSVALPQNNAPAKVDTAKVQAADSLKKPAKDENVSDLIHFNPSNTLDDIKGNGNSFVLTVIGMGVVFFALAALYLSFTLASNLIKRSVAKKHAKESPEKEGSQPKEEMSAEVNAAIAMALYSFFNANHDQENTILTINRVSRMYTPWSSKIYNLRHHPRNW